MLNKNITNLDGLYLKIIITSFIIISSRWFLSYYFFDDSLNIKLFFDTKGDGFYYYPFIKYLSDFTFNPSFDPDIKNLNFITLPIHTIFIHTLFYKIIGLSSIILMQFICLSIFLLIFCYYLIEINLNKNLTILISLIIFYIPSIIEFQNFFNIVYLNNISFYDFRFPNKLITNLYFYIFVLLILYFDKKYKTVNDIKIKDYFIISIILSFIFGSYYYLFFISSLTLLIFMIYKNNFKINFIINNLKKFIYLFFFTFLFSIPVFLNIFFVESDFLQRLGIFHLNIENKKIILKYIINNLIRFDFLILVFFNIIFLYIINKKKLDGHRVLNVFFIIFISSIFAPIIFFIISNQSLFISPFFGYIALFLFFNFVLEILIILRVFINSIFNKKSYFKFLVILISILCVQFYAQYNEFKIKKENDKYYKYRKDLSKISSKLLKLKEKNSKIEVLTYDRIIQVWLVVNDFPFIRPISGQLTSKKHKMIEDDVIRSLKFLKVNKKDFITFIKPIKINSRYSNSNAQNYFWHRYTANSLQTYKNSKDFDPDVLLDIENIPIIHHQSLIIPNFELKRLVNKFENFKLNQNYSPDVIIIRKSYLNMIQIPNHYCINSELYTKIIIYKKLINECK